MIQSLLGFSLPKIVKQEKFKRYVKTLRIFETCKLTKNIFHLNVLITYRVTKKNQRLSTVLIKHRRVRKCYVKWRIQEKNLFSVQCYDISFCFLLDSTSSTILLVLIIKTALISHCINLYLRYLWIMEFSITRKYKISKLIYLLIFPQ